MVKTAFKGYIFGRKNSHSTEKCVIYMPEMYYDKETLVMFNQQVNEFYIRLQLKIDKFPQDVVLTLDIAAKFSTT